jgi:hypothetical protein
MQARPGPPLIGTGESTMDTLLIILLALTTVAIPVLTETAAAAHIFDAWGRADFAWGPASKP